MKQIIATLAFFFLSGCVVFPETYFLPSSTEGVVTRSLCRGTIGPKDVLVFKIDDVDLRFEVDEHKSSLDFRIVFYIPEGGSVVWVGNDISLQTSDQKYFDGELNHFMQVNYENGISKSKPYPIGDAMTYYKKPYSEKVTYVGVVEFKISDLSKIVIKGLSFKVNDKLYELDAIHFTKKRGIFIYPLNC